MNAICLVDITDIHITMLRHPREMSKFARMKQGNNDLTSLAHAPVGRLLWQYSLPAVTGMLVMALYNVIDRVFIGRVVGPDAIAGLAITLPVMNLSAALGVLVGAGAAARTSILLGAGRVDRARQVLGNSLTLLLINASVYLTLFAIFLDDLLRAFGASDATLPYARDFMSTLLPGMLMMNLSFSFNNIMRASGYPVKAMLAMMLGAGLNALLAPIFIYLLDWGIRGAAVATDISMTVSAAWVLSHFMRPGVNVGFTRGTYRLQWSVVRSVIAIGAAPALVNAASCMINVIINRSLYSYGGDSAVAAAGVFVTFSSLLVAIVLGICQGMQPVVGYNYGAGRPDRLRRTFFLAAAASTVICTTGAAIAILSPQSIARMFTTDSALIAEVGGALPRAMSAFMFVGVQIVSTTLFQSIGKAGKSIVLSLTRQVLFLIPLLLFLPPVMGLEGVWLSFPASDLLATVVTVAMVVWQLRVIARMRPAAPPSTTCSPA